MNVVIVGQGAIGLLWYVKLDALNNVQLPTKLSNTLPTQLSSLSLRPSNYAKNRNETPAVITFTDNQNKLSRHHLLYATDNNIACADILLLAVKSYQVKTALSNLLPLMKKNSSIILSHNGLGTVEELPTEVINHHTIYSLLTTHGCLRTDALAITHTGKGHCDLGIVHTGIDVNFNAQQQLITLLHQAFPDVIFHKNIAEKQWIKLAINCVINPITALYNVSNGEINSTRFSSLIKNILAEVVAVAWTQGIILELTLLIQNVQGVAKATAKNQSSMSCDVQNNKKTEVDFINGYIHRLGEKYQINTPENTRLWQAITALKT